MFGKRTIAKFEKVTVGKWNWKKKKIWKLILDQRTLQKKLEYIFEPLTKSVKIMLDLRVPEKIYKNIF